MFTSMRKLTPFFLVFFTLCFVEAGIMADYSDARSRGGGRSFRSTPRKKAPVTQKQQPQAGQQKSGFGRGLAGGLLGGALGGMLFGSMFGMGGSGMGILPMLLLAVVGYFFYRRFMARPKGGAAPGYQPPPQQTNVFGGNNASSVGGGSPAPPPVSDPAVSSLEDGIAQIQTGDPDFDPAYFIEVASDVFFKVQAGWMRRDISSYRHLLGDQLASEYAAQFAEMEEKGELNKLENISIRNVEVVDAGSENGEDFVTVLFTANLLDYTVNDKNGDLISGSMTDPVKFAEEWSWARPLGTQDWKLEGIKEV